MNSGIPAFEFFDENCIECKVCQISLDFESRQLFDGAIYCDVHDPAQRIADMITGSAKCMECATNMASSYCPSCQHGLFCAHCDEKVHSLMIMKDHIRNNPEMELPSIQAGIDQPESSARTKRVYLSPSPPEAPSRIKKVYIDSLRSVVTYQETCPS